VKIFTQNVAQHIFVKIRHLLRNVFFEKGSQIFGLGCLQNFIERYQYFIITQVAKSFPYLVTLKNEILGRFG
jgi:hypothetical protein